VPLSFRVTAATRQKLEAAALANGRSLTAEAESRLERSFDREEFEAEAEVRWEEAEVRWEKFVAEHFERFLETLKDRLPEAGQAPVPGRPPGHNTAKAKR
jgi:tRNA U54 and U55 pseudouridine synthase Pus10